MVLQCVFCSLAFAKYEVGGFGGTKRQSLVNTINCLIQVITQHLIFEWNFQQIRLVIAYVTEGSVQFFVCIEIVIDSLDSRCELHKITLRFCSFFSHKSHRHWIGCCASVTADEKRNRQIGLWLNRTKNKVSSIIQLNIMMEK